jgi:uncharacterized membrane protein
MVLKGLSASHATLKSLKERENVLNLGSYLLLAQDGSFLVISARVSTLALAIGYGVVIALVLYFKFFKKRP